LLGDTIQAYSDNHKKFLSDKVDPVPWFSDQILQVLRTP
jgi:hypothetical protein